MNKWRDVLATALLVLSASAAEDFVWNGQNRFPGIGDPGGMELKFSDGLMCMEISRTDPSVTISNFAIDPKRYSCFEFDYRATGVPEENNGQIFFAGKSGDFSAERRFVFSGLIPDGQWHTATVTTVIGGEKIWRDAGMIRGLRFDPIDQGVGRIEIRELRATNPNPLSGIVPEDDDIASISSLYPQLFNSGRGTGAPFWIGKGNQFDHRYRGLFRFRLDTLLPAGKVNKALLEFKLAGFYGSLDERNYVVEVFPGDIQKLKGIDASAAAEAVVSVALGRGSIGLPIQIDVTDAVNRALEHVQTGVTFRVRSEPEENQDPSASGAVVDCNSIQLITE